MARSNEANRRVGSAIARHGANASSILEQRAKCAASHLADAMAFLEQTSSRYITQIATRGVSEGGRSIRQSISFRCARTVIACFTGESHHSEFGTSRNSWAVLSNSNWSRRARPSVRSCRYGARLS
jgi:hypothetical protein